MYQVQFDDLTLTSLPRQKYLLSDSNFPLQDKLTVFLSESAITTAPTKLQYQNQFIYSTPVGVGDYLVNLFYQAACKSPDNGQISTSAVHAIAIGIAASTTGERPFAGGAGNAVELDGADDLMYVNVNKFPTNQFTITLWMKSMT